jgi:acetyl-CoA C-acetyltransferase
MVGTDLGEGERRMEWTKTPVLVGAGQLTNREEDPAKAPDPFTMMEVTAREAASGLTGSAPKLLEELTHVWMVHSLSLRHQDPAGYLAERLGATAAEARCSGMGGSVPQWLVNRACDLVVSGTRPRVLIVGAEALATRKRAKRAGVELNWPSSKGWPDTWPPIEPDLGVHPVERSHGLEQATAMYALIETAVAHEAGEDPSKHLWSMAELMARFNETATRNPYSWFPTRRGSDELATVDQDNRIIYYPYPKYMNAVMDVDMSAAVIVTDAETARSWGMSADELVYVSGWADAHDLWYLSERPAVHRSDALAECAKVALEVAGSGVEEISAFDLYSCFPSSIEVARDCLGIGSGDRRPLTLTGGLPYHGGPGSNYVTHAIANAHTWLGAGRLGDERNAAGGQGGSVLVQGNGYYLTKQSVGIYSRRPPAAPELLPADLQERIDKELRPVPLEEPTDGTGTVVAYTAPYDRDGHPLEGIVLVEVDGHRTLARTKGPLTDELLAEDGVGKTVALKEGSAQQLD